MKAPNQKRNQYYADGLAAETTIKKFFIDKGYNVIDSTFKEDYFYDIDCYINDWSVSIKTQHKGEKYGHIGFEIANHLTSCNPCQVSDNMFKRGNITYPGVIKLIEVHKTWEAGWWLTSQAQVYIIQQGDYIRVYRSEDIRKYVSDYSFLKLRPLKQKTQSYMGGSYRHCNTICGYLDREAIKHDKYLLTN